MSGRLLIVTSLLGVMYPLLNAYADTIQRLVSYTCDQKADRIVLDLQSASGSEGAELAKNEGTDAWDPWSLITSGGRENATVTGVRQIHRMCRLSDGAYDVTIIPEPDNTNLLGRCGVSITVKVKISLRGKTLLMNSFGDTCFHGDAVTYSEISLKAKGHRVELTQDD